MDIKVIIILVLLVASLGLAYMLFVTFPQQAEVECAAGCEAKIETEVIPQLTSAAEAECAAAIEAQVTSALQSAAQGIQECQQTLQQLLLVPACAAVLQQ